LGLDLGANAVRNINRGGKGGGKSDKAGKGSGKSDRGAKALHRLQTWQTNSLPQTWYIAFTHLISTTQYAPLGLTLLAILARVCAITGLSGYISAVADWEEEKRVEDERMREEERERIRREEDEQEDAVEDDEDERYRRVLERFGREVWNDSGGGGGCADDGVDFGVVVQRSTEAAGAGAGAGSAAATTAAGLSASPSANASANTNANQGLMSKKRNTTTNTTTMTTTTTSKSRFLQEEMLLPPERDATTRLTNQKEEEEDAERVLEVNKQKTKKRTLRAMDDNTDTNMKPKEKKKKRKKPNAIDALFAGL